MLSQNNGAFNQDTLLFNLVKDEDMHYLEENQNEASGDEEEGEAEIREMKPVQIKMHYGQKEIKEEALFKMLVKYWGYLMFMNRKNDKDSISTLFANNLNKNSKHIKKFNHLKAKSGRLTKI